MTTNDAGAVGQNWLPQRRALATLLGGLLLAGCVAGGRPSAPPEGVGPDQRLSGAGPLQDGRTGFVIWEELPAGDQLRGDFDAAVALLREERYEPAIALLERIAAQEPRVSAPYIDLAIAYRRVGRPEPAEAELRRALELVPAHPVASNEYGLLLREAGRFDEARAVFEESLHAFPEYLPVRRNLGILCDLYLDDPACALDQYQTYYDTRPEDEQVGIWIAALKLRLND